MEKVIIESMKKILEESNNKVEENINKFDEIKGRIINEQGRELEKIILDKIPEEIVSMTNAKYFELRYEALSENNHINMEDTMYNFDKIRERVKKGKATIEEEKIYKSIKAYGK
uniref:Carboxypeptidase n=1 Tax=Strongyloides stercoralis TaxID=6248 RepID=A0A0K0EKK7_STRER